MKLYHGTPNNFDSFDTNHIGSGEGHQVHGWGLYFSEDKELVTRRYAERLSKRLHSVLTVDGVEKEITDDSTQSLHDLFPDIPEPLCGLIGFWGFNFRKQLDKYIEMYQRYVDEGNGNVRIFTPWNEPNPIVSNVLEKYREYKKYVDEHNIIYDERKSKSIVFTVEIPDNLVFLDEGEIVKGSMIHRFGVFVSEKKQEISDGLHDILYPLIESDKKKYPYPMNACDSLSDDFVRYYKYIKNNWNDLPEVVNDTLSRRTNGWLNLPKEYLNRIYDYLKSVNMENIFPNEVTGDEFYHILSKNSGGNKETSLFLEQNGINGIRYYGNIDGLCYVIFNPDNITIIKKEVL